MGSIEAFVEKLENDCDVVSDSHHIIQPPTYSTIDICNENAKNTPTSNSKTPQNFKTVFEQEFERFCDELSSDPKQKKKLEFFKRIKVQNAMANCGTIQDSVEKLARNCADKKLRRVYGVFVPVVEALKDYTAVVDTMVQSYPMPLALIWGGLKIVLDCAGRYSQQFEKIKTELQRLPDILWDLSSCEDLYGTSPYSADVARRTICSSYRIIFKFWYRSAKILEHPKRYALMENRKLAGLVFDLERSWETLQKIRDGVEAQLDHEMREKIATEANQAEGMRRKLTEEFVKMALERSATQIEREKAEEERLKAELDRAAAQKERELAEAERQKAAEERMAAEHERQEAYYHRNTDLRWKCEQNRLQAAAEIRSLMSRLEGRDRFGFELFDSVLKERHPGTCEWLFQNQKFQNWATEDNKSPVLWLNGKHGAGKSFLCASAIDFIRGSPPSKPVAFQFLTKDQFIPRIQLLQNLACQLLDCLVLRSTEIPESLAPFLEINKDDSGSLERLIHFILMELPFTYIFIDGLDEADYTEGQFLGLAHRYNKAVPDVVTFLIQEAVQFPGKLRLWVSSQPSPGIQDYVCQPQWKDIISEIPLQIEDTADDIQRYLLAAIPDTAPDTTSFARMLITSAIATDVEGSFLWASSMLHDLKDEAEDTDDLIRLASEGLPREMSSLYTKAINRMKKQDRGSKILPLWKIILSLLTFTKRPLRISEIIEAVAMIRTAKGENLSDNKRVDPRKILNGCLSLVRHIKIDRNYQNDILHLSHSAVRTFLMKHSDKADAPLDEADQFVSSQIIRDSCLNYLSQPRYRKLFDKDSYGVFWADDDEDVGSHRLLSYAAKYWYQHFDTREDCSGLVPPEQCDKDQVLGFLRSPNFQTCLQVQSLFVIGHFLQRCDSITDQVKTVRKTLPNWMPLYENNFHRQYLEFQGEWCDLLQCGQSQQFNGEIDRCFWSALGAKNFLAQNVSRYQSFQFKQYGSATEEEARCQIQQLSPDGETLMTGWVQTQGESKELHLEQWAIDGVNLPRMTSQTIIPFSAIDTQLDLYSLPCSRTFQSFPLIPSLCVVPPDAISITDVSALRIGSKIFENKLGTQKMKFSLLKDRVLGEPWENIRTRGPYMVTCRRRIPRPQPSATSKAQERLRAREARKRGLSFRANSRSQRDESDHESETSDEEDAHESDSLSNGSDSGGEAEDSAEESWSEGSDTEDTSDNDSDFAEAEESNSEASEAEFDLEELKKSVPSDSHIKSEATADSDGASEDSDLDSAKSVVSFDEVADDSDSDDSIQSDTSERSVLNPELIAQEPEKSSYPVDIARASGSKICDGCDKNDIERYLHCVICQENDFDICNACERRGRWCFDKAHRMYRVINYRFAGVVASRMNFTVQQELSVYRTDNKGKKMRVFRFKRNYYDSILHDSPPIIHPEHSLVVWAITGDRLLFADFESNTFFQQKLDATTSKKARPICVSLSFSPCGGFLRVASIEAVIQKPHESAQNRRSKNRSDKPKVCLYMHIMILRLSPKKPTRIPPKMVAMTSLRLGCDMKPHVQNLPFAFTWTANELFLTLSHARLRVYRVSISPAIFKPKGVHSTTTSPDHESPEMMEFKITVPKECIFLPRSSRNRSVQFFPPNTAGGNSIVIIGPRHDKHPTPPIGVYLKDHDLGGWVPIEDKESEGMLHMPQKRLQGQFEEFDEEQDCDLIPFD